MNGGVSVFDSRSQAKEMTVSGFPNQFAQKINIYGISTGYCISASLLSIINKWALTTFPYPGLLTALQYSTTAAAVLISGHLHLLHHDPLTPLTMFRFLPAAFIFYLSLLTNTHLLLHANVDTFIVFRSALPIFVALGESLFLHRPWPLLNTWLSLTTIFCGGLLFLITDFLHHLDFQTYLWAAAYLASMTVDFVYIKHVVMSIGLDTWGLVLYNNLEALLLFPLQFFASGEFNKVMLLVSSSSSSSSYSFVLPVGVSCLFGLAISFFGFSCRRGISATGFTVLGIVNKILTVVVNLVIWDKHSSLVGTVGLFICMLGGVAYQQSTMERQKEEGDGVVGDEEQHKLIQMSGADNNINGGHDEGDTVQSKMEAKLQVEKIAGVDT